MSRFVTLTVATLIVLAAFAGCVCGATPGKFFQVWMGLERTGEHIEADLAQLASHLDYVKSVSFEQYNLGENSQLLVAPLARVGPQLKKMGMRTLPMISTFNDTPPNRRPTDIVHCRQVFANPDPFIAAAIQFALDNGWDGWNVDFEPSGGTADDAENYATFLNLFAEGLHQHGMVLSVDIASWDKMWNWTLLARTKVDEITLMDTYTGNNAIFQTRLELAVQTFGVDRLVVGLESLNPNTNKPFSLEDMQYRFNLIKQNGVRMLSMWEMPVPELWWPLIKDFLDSP